METQVSGRMGMSGGRSPRHAQNPLSVEIIFKEDVITSSVVKITYIVAEITFNVAGVTSSVAKIMFVVTESTFVVAAITFRVTVITS